MGALALGAPAWTLLATSGTPPSAREGHVAIYDPVGDRMVVFGGNDGAVRSDAWALSLADPPTWTALAPAGTAPAARAWCGGAYDSARQRMLVFGGTIGGGGVTNDTWALDLSGSTSWSAIPTRGTLPVARQRLSLIYDPVRDRLLAISGTSGGSGLGFTTVMGISGLTLSTGQWQDVYPYVFCGRAAAIYDPVRDRVVFHGGSLDFGTPTNMTWSFTLGAIPTATRISPTQWPPGGATDPSAIVDPLRNRLVIFGGLYATGFEPNPSNDTKGLPLSGTPDWIPLGGSSPSPRYGHTAVCDAEHDRMVVFGGGSSYIGLVSETWALPLGPGGTWSNFAPTGTPPAARFQHSAVVDPANHRMIVFGGLASNFPMPEPIPRFNDVWELRLDTKVWSQLSPLGTPPAVRSGHTAIFDEANHRMIVFGGRNSGGLLGDVWALQLSGTPTWTQLFPTGTPPSPRDEHSAVYDAEQQRMWVYGATPIARSGASRSRRPRAGLRR